MVVQCRMTDPDQFVPRQDECIRQVHDAEVFIMVVSHKNLISAFGGSVSSFNQPAAALPTTPTVQDHRMLFPTPPRGLLQGTQ